MEKEGGGSGGAARFGDDAALERQFLYGGTNLVFSDGDDVVDVFENVLEGNLAHGSGAHAVSDGLGDGFGIPLDQLFLVETVTGISGDLRLHAVDFHFFLL